MNYRELSLDELKNIAKAKNIFVNKNIGKDKLIDKIEKYDAEENAKSFISSDDIMDDITSEDVVYETPQIENSISKENLINAITDVVSDLEGFEEDDEIDDSIEDIGMDEEVPCMSISFGGLTYISQLTGAKYKWHKIGDIEYISVKELVSMNNSKPTFLNKPLIILKDIRAVNKFRLISKYEDVAKINSLKKLFASANMDEIERTIDSALSVGMREVVISKVRTMYNNGVLNNTHIIALLQDKLKFDFATDL